MAKPKSEEPPGLEPATGAEPDPDPPPEEPTRETLPEPEPSGIPPGLEEFVAEGAPWNGHRRFECRRCPFDSLDLETALEHARTHLPPEPPPPAPSGLLDAYGNPIVR